MENTNVEVEKESNAILSKLSEEQFNQFRRYFGYKYYEFYPTLNTELLTRIRENFNWIQKRCKVDLTEEEAISIVKDYGSVSHQLVVDGEVTYEPRGLSDYLTFDISAEKIEEVGVDEIKKWGEGGFWLEKVEKNLKSHSIISEYSSLVNLVNECCDPDYDIDLSGVRVVTKVDVSIPNREELFPEKKVA